MFDDAGKEIDGTLVREPKAKKTPEEIRLERIARLPMPRGRPKGVPNKATIAIKEFLRCCLDDPRYRARFRRQMFNGEISPALEQMAYHYVIGKPREQIDITATVGITTLNLERLTDAQLQQVRDLLQGVPQHALAEPIDVTPQPAPPSEPADGEPPT